MVSAFEGVVKREDWDKYESRIEHNTHRLLNILNGSFRNPQSAIRNPVRATFFCLGWVAERYPHLIREIHQQGHEIGCHSYDHRLVYGMTPDEFREDIRKSKRLLEDAIGAEVIGYRAPSYSITKNSLWAFEVLIEEGFKYDSSIFPIRHDRYGIPNAPRFPFLISVNGNNTFEINTLNQILEVTPHSALRIPHCLSPNPELRITNLATIATADSINSINSTNPTNGTNSSILAGLTPNSELRTPNRLLEFPISTVRMLGQNIPISGGGYFRLFPYRMVKGGLRRICESEGIPFVFYVHPWEIDPDQPRFRNCSRLSRFRHYVNLGKTESRFRKLLNDFHFSPIRDVAHLGCWMVTQAVSKNNQPK